MMPNKQFKPYALGVLVDDVWLSGVQEFSAPYNFSTRGYSDKGRIQVSKVQADPKGNLDITIRRLIGDGKFFYQPSDLSSYASSFLLANSNLGLSGEDGFKEFKVQMVYGDENDSYLGASASNYVSLDTYEYCLLQELSYSITPKGIITETIRLTTRNQTTTSGGALAGLALPSFPEVGNILKSEHVDLINSTFPTIIDTIYDNGWNTLYGRDSEHGKYALQNIELSFTIEYGELGDRGRPRGSVTPSQQNRWRYVSNTSVECSISGFARQGDIDKAVDDKVFMTASPDPSDQIKIVAQLGSNYYVWDLGSKNFVTNLTRDLGGTPDTVAEFGLTFSNRRHDFIPYVNSSILTLTQSGTY